MNTSEDSKRIVAPVRMLAAAALTSAAMESVESAASTPCDQSAELFIETGTQLIGHGAIVTIDVGGESGAAPFTFASGTAQADVIAAINSMVQSTGVVAQASEVNPDRVQLQSILPGGDAFVSAQQTSGSDPLIHPSADRGSPVWRLIAHGETGIAGDADCDGMVGTGDLQIVIGHWGACPPALSCPGDVNLSGIVNLEDLLLVINHWG